MQKREKSTVKAECPYCGEVCKRHSVNNKGSNVFVCQNKKCPKVNEKNKSKIYFTEKVINELTPDEANYLGAILSLLRFEQPPTGRKFVKINILSAIKRHLASSKTLGSLEFEIKSLKPEEVNYQNTQYFKAKPISCYNPKLVICQDGNKISIIKLPEHQFKEVSAAEIYKSYQNIRLLNASTQNIKKINTIKKNMERRPKSNYKPDWTASEYWRKRGKINERWKKP